MTETKALVQEKLQVVLNAMARTGYEIKQPVEIAVDEKLPFMGYTSRHWQSHVIVVSGAATESPMLEGLLTHELSHVYRNLTNHPSHNERIIGAAAENFAQLHPITEDYQEQALHQAINHIQDLYADDIATKVLQKNQGTNATSKMLGEFFLGWIKEEPVKSNAPRKDGWLNAGILLNNCFAVSNIQRRKAQDYIKKAEALNDEFLARVNANARNDFAYFNRFMVNLRERVTEGAFSTQLSDYLERFWQTITSI